VHRIVSAATAGSELATSAVHTATATVLAPVIRFADISPAPDSTQKEPAAQRAVFATGWRSGGEDHVEPLGKFAPAAGRPPPPHERDPAADRDQFEPFCTGHAFGTIRKTNGPRAAAVRQLAAAEAGLARGGERLNNPWIAMSLAQRVLRVSLGVTGQHAVGSVNARPSDAVAQAMNFPGR
jgi:hypothetical protein